MEFIESLNLGGLALGIATFLTIGIFHPIVIKCEYHFGVGCWWWFLILGLIFCALSVLTENWLISTVLGVVAFSSFWSILEIFQQRKRVQKGWFPKNPKRKY
ncbi:MAG: DUF4491 family protein [Bacteroidales bacterium]|nr:DUF4491 family protein [Bacteroidales bacterium]